MGQGDAGDDAGSGAVLQHHGDDEAARAEFEGHAYDDSGLGTGSQKRHPRYDRYGCAATVPVDESDRCADQCTLPQRHAGDAERPGTA